MKKSMIFAIAIIALLAAPFVHAETYSGIERFSDNAKLVFSGGDSKVNLALDIREKEIDSAIENLGNEEKALKNIENAEKKLVIVQEKVSLATAGEIKSSSEEIMDKIEASDSEIFDDYLLEEEKTMLTAVLIEKTLEYCKELANEDFVLMLNEEECNPDTAIPGLEEELKELKDIQIKLFVKLMLEIRSCIDDPGTCNCEANTDAAQKAKCEEMVALALKCEYKADESSCSELKAMEPRQGDSFAESFVPSFLMNLFKDKSYMVEYDIEPSDGVPEECWDENTKPECRQYDHLKETNADWDEYGHYIGRRPENKEPTMQESIPQCFDEDNNFLEEKCGKITVVRNEEGLVNYLAEKDIDGILGQFENQSMQNTIDEGEWTIDEGEWTIDGDGLKVDDGQMQVQGKAREIKKVMNQISNRIKNINMKPSSGEICCKKRINGGIKYKWDPEEVCVSPDDIAGEVVDNDFCLALGSAIDIEDDIITEGVPEECASQGVYDKESCGLIMSQINAQRRQDVAGGAGGSGGLSPEVRTGVAGGDGGLKPEVKTGGVRTEEPLPVPDLTRINPDLVVPPQVITNVIDNPGVEVAPDPGSPGTNDVAPAVDVVAP